MTGMDRTDVCVKVLRMAGYRVTGDQVMHVATDFESGLKFLDVVTEAYPE
jgi:hypothetical protein